MAHVFVGMSGGVDSSATALLLLQAGHRLSGINFPVFPQSEKALHQRALADDEDARAVADQIEAAFPNLDGKVLINSIGTVIGSHTGPGTVALFYWGDARIN